MVLIDANWSGVSPSPKQRVRAQWPAKPEWRPNIREREAVLPRSESSRRRSAELLGGAAVGPDAAALGPLAWNHTRTLADGAS